MGTKSATLLVTTIRPCSRAVAEIIRSALSLPSAALSWSQRLTIERQNPDAVESQHAVEPRRERRSENPGLLHAAVRCRIRSHHRDDAHEKIGRPLPFDLCCQAYIAAAYGAPTKRLYRSGTAEIEIARTDLEQRKFAAVLGYGKQELRPSGGRLGRSGGLLSKRG